MKKRITIILTLILSLVTVIGSTGCSKESRLEKKIQGRWEVLGGDGAIFEFDDGEFTMYHEGEKSGPSDYEIDGTDIIVKLPGGDMVFEIVEVDGDNMDLEINGVDFDLRKE